MSRKLKSSSVRISDVVKNACPPYWTCTKLLLHLQLLNPTSTTAKQVDDWIHANKVCRHTLLSVLSNDLFDVYASYKNAKDIWDSLILKYTAEDIVRQRSVIGNYYHWEMIEGKDIKVQINKYHKLLEDIKLKT